MNVKTLRKSYENMTMLERLSLADNALARDDENELRAVVAASPRKNFSQVDYHDLMREITHFRLCNLIVRLSYIMQFDYFSVVAELEILKNKSDFAKREKLFTSVRMAAFLFVRATDSWKAVSKEFGLRPDFDEEMSRFLFSLDLMKDKEEIMRKLAFNEDEAKKHIKGQTGEEKIQTLEDEIKAIKEALSLPSG